MRPGKIFRPTDAPVPMFPIELESDGTPVGRFTHAYPHHVFLVIAVDEELSKEHKRIANWHDLQNAWVVLFNEKVYLAEVHKRRLMDLTPFAPWDTRYECNAELIEDYRQHVR